MKERNKVSLFYVIASLATTHTHLRIQCREETLLWNKASLAHSTINCFETHSFLDGCQAHGSRNPLGQAQIPYSARVTVISEGACFQHLHRRTWNILHDSDSNSVQVCANRSTEGCVLVYFRDLFKA